MPPISASLAALTAALLALGGCTVTRPAPLACPGLLADDATPLVARSTGAGAPSPEAAATRMVERAIAAEVAEAGATPGSGPITLRIVSLSAGGQWGAYSAGLMTGWSRNPATPRPAFDVVTGVSAGAIVGVPTFAGPAFDPVLAFYRGIGEADVSTRRSLPALLRAPSLADPAPLEAFLRRSVTPALVAAIAARNADGDQLLVSATNLDTTEGRILDLGAAARANPPDRAADCIVEALLASAAIPGLLPPRNIDGALYADGGLRDQVFFRAVDTARAREARALGREIRVEAFLVVNGPLLRPTTPADDRLLGYVARSVETLADEVQRDSVIDAVAFARARPGWTLRGMVPRVDLSGCGFADGVPTSTFDPCLTRTVFDAGVAAGMRVPIDWMDADELRAIADEL